MRIRVKVVNDAPALQAKVAVNDINDRVQPYILRR